VRAPFSLEKETDLGEAFLEKSIIERRFEGIDEIINHIWNTGYLPSDDYFDSLDNYKKGVLTALWFSGKYDIDTEYHMRLKTPDRSFVDDQKKITAELILHSDGTTFNEGVKNALYYVYHNYPYRVRNFSGELGLSEAEYKTLIKLMFQKISASF
jgi:hypothetical protein